MSDHCIPALTNSTQLGKPAESIMPCRRASTKVLPRTSGPNAILSPGDAPKSTFRGVLGRLAASAKVQSRVQSLQATVDLERKSNGGRGIRTPKGLRPPDFKKKPRTPPESR
jgi:hypothetical protein